MPFVVKPTVIDQIKNTIMDSFIRKIKNVWCHYETTGNNIKVVIFAQKTGVYGVTCTVENK